MTTSKSSTELLPLGFRFAREFFIVSILLMFVDYGLDQYAERVVPTVVLSFLPALVGAFSVSIAFVRQFQRGCTSVESHLLALFSVALSFIISLIFFCISIIFSMVSGGFSAGALVDMIADAWVVLVFVLALVLILSITYLILRGIYKGLTLWLSNKNKKTLSQ